MAYSASQLVRRVRAFYMEMKQNHTPEAHTRDTHQGVQELRSHIEIRKEKI